MAFNKKILLATTLIAGFAITAPSLAMAQQQPQRPQQPQTQNDDDDDATAVETVTVTGTRIRRNEFTSSAPVQIITGEESTLAGLVDTGELLQQSTITGGAFQINSQLTGFVVEGGGGADSLSLRGLGANRTLILLNGRRLGPAGTRGQVQAVDLNTIPQSIIERVEILKDGASSVYGSDAVAGVVNIITRTNLDGIEASASYTRPFEDGGGSQRFNVGWGTTFDRGYVSASLDYNRREPLRRGDRDETACAADYLFNPTTGDRLDYRGLDGEYKCYNLGNNYAAVLRGTDNASFGNFQYRVPGVTYPTLAQQGYAGPITIGGAPLNAAFVRGGRNGFAATFPYFNTTTPFYDRATAISPVERYTATLNVGYDLTPSTEVYGEFFYNRRQSEQDGVRQLFPQLRVGNVNARQPDGSQFSGTSTDRVQPVIALPSDSDQEIDYYRAVAGIRGDFGSSAGFLSNWTWDIYGQYARSEGEYTDDIIYRDRMNALGDTRDFGGTSATTAQPGFLTACYQNAPTGNVFNPGNVSGYSCSDLPGGIPWTSARILAGDFNAAERAFLFARETGTTTYEHMYLEGFMSGDLFELPAGPVGAAVGFQIRREELNDTPGAQSILGNRWGQTAAGITAGSDSVREVFGEVEIPLLRGMTGVDELTANISGRYSDYDSYGSNSTYKIGLNWQITPAWRVRGTYGTSFRAPALYEQFLGNQTGFLAQGSIDACINYDTNPNASATLIANCQSVGIGPGFGGSGSSATIITGGGAGILDAESADNLTVGVIWTPAFIDLSVALDYFEIEVEDEVAQFGAFNIVNSCYSSTQFPNDPFCALFVRNPTTLQIETVNNSYVNLSSQTNRGIDLTIRYAHEFDFGDLTLNFDSSWQLQDTIQLFEGFPADDFLGTTFGNRGPDWVGNFSARFDRGDWTAFWVVNMTGKGSDTEVEGGDVFASARYGCGNAALAGCSGPVNAAAYYKQYNEFTALHTASVRYQMDDWTFQAGVRNIFDEMAPNSSTGQFRIGTAAIGYNYDALLGRQGFVNVTRRF